MSIMSRERIALIVFVICIVLILSGIAVYMVLGHSWNYAATHIDDAAGEMEGYRVVLVEGTAVPNASQVNAQGNRTSKAVSLAQAAKSYREKGAEVFIIHSDDLESYHHPQVIQRGSYRIGVMQVQDEDTQRALQSSCKALESRDVAATIAIASDVDRLEKIDGIDIILDVSGSGAVSGTSRSHEGYRVKMSEVGTVTAIVISPAEVVSARTLRSL